MTTNQKQLDKMGGTQVIDLDDEEDDDDDEDSYDDAFGVEGGASGTGDGNIKKKRKRGKPASNVMCLTSCMAGQCSRYVP